MSIQELLSVICQWINSLGYKAIQAPSDNPAPAGKYISVGVGTVLQHGEMLIPSPIKETSTVSKKNKSVMHVAQIQLYEVEGDGEALRRIKDLLQLDEFDEFVKSHTQSTPAQDNGFSVWNIGEIIDNSGLDGAYWVNQKILGFDVQFYDYLQHNTQKIKSVKGKRNNENFSVTL